MSQSTKQSNLFDDFKNLYSLSKTLRFELRPTPETAELLKKTNLQGKTPVQVDQEIDELYHKEMKPLFDELHEKFISETLVKVTFEVTDLEQLETKYLELKNLNKDRKNNSTEIKKLTDNTNGEIPKLENRLREIIVEQFNKLGEDWKEKYNEINLDDAGYKILTNAKILDLLLLLYPEKSEPIKKFQGFFTYFSGLNQNRENYYTGKDDTTGVASRIINKNLVLFLNNKSDFEEFVDKMSDLSEYRQYFELGNFSNCLTQEGIENYNDKVGEVKSKVNIEHNQKVENKKQQLKGLIQLQKQIGCKTKQQREQEASGKSIYPEYLEKVGLGFQIIKDDLGEYQIWEALNYITEELKPKLEKLKENYQNFFSNWQEYKLDEIWFRKESVNTISGRWFGGDNWSILARALAYSGTGKMEKGEYKIPPFVSLLDLKEALEVLESGVDFDIKKSKKKNNPETSIKEAKKFSYTAENLFKDDYKTYFKTSLFETLLAVWQYQVDYKFDQIESFTKEFEEESKVPFDKRKKDTSGRSIHTEVVKNLIEEGYLRLFQITKYHNLEKKGEVDARATENKFYDALNEFWEENPIVTYHKAFQATLTKKPYSENKIKLNFENGSLLGGFSDGQEKNKAGVILQEGNKFYLGILRNRGFFRTDKPNPIYQTEDKSWQRLILTNLKFQTLAGKGFLGKYKASYGKLGKTDPIQAISLLQEFIRTNYIQKYPQLESVASQNYKSKKDFDAEIKKALTECFTMNFTPISKDVLQQGLIQESLYLFEITNKDFSEYSKGKNKNVHTLYWQKLFGDKNLEKPILALNGGAEVFFRKGQKDKLDKKLDKSGKEILSNKRYGEDKYFLHASITINYGKPKIIKFKELINQAIVKNRDDIKIIGIDRGEKHLLYYSVIDSNGTMVDQGSLNIINEVDYNSKLQERQDKRNQARLDWEEIGNIKNFKEGYLSQAVNKIYELIIKHNAVVVMEDLNSEFKAKRAAKVEKSVYKKFELALVRKLNHLILKDKRPNELGDVLNAYQLTPYIEAGKVGNFEKARQWGILFYVRANYTSTTDPLTGWRKHLYISNSETELKMQEFFKQNDGVQINYDLNRKCFKFNYITDDGRQWELFAFEGLQRFYWDNKNREIKTHDLHKEFEELFARLDKLKNINQQIYGKDFSWKTLVFLWNLLTQIRNTDKSKTGNENDFLQSPVYSDRYHQFFDSRKITDKHIPDNGDANGAYNIARKGVMVMKKIKDHAKDDSEFKKNLNLFISDEEWDKAVSDWGGYVSKP